MTREILPAIYAAAELLPGTADYRAAWAGLSFAVVRRCIPGEA